MLKIIIFGIVWFAIAIMIAYFKYTHLQRRNNLAIACHNHNTSNYSELIDSLVEEYDKRL